jgi:hypothetical protein
LPLLIPAVFLEWFGMTADRARMVAICRIVRKPGFCDRSGRESPDQEREKHDGCEEGAV